jgi:hypothetical protein
VKAPKAAYDAQAGSPITSVTSSEPATAMLAWIAARRSSVPRGPSLSTRVIVLDGRGGIDSSCQGAAAGLQ